ncbi:MAG: sugar phosphate isomerase/epimerase [Candidatus Ratteibacteria bacterium]|nr:sugar phosphate isomerase/epimerase [Candidatus Ratteibacteria bacterium]
MKLSGISDEAGQAIEKQIQAHKELGWEYLELRNVDGEAITLMPDKKFDGIFEKVVASGLKVSCFASCIANWATEISGNFQKDVDELKMSIPRMHRFNTKYIRVMSWPNNKQDPLPDEEWGKEAIKRMKELTKIAEDGGVVLVHENCSGWGEPSNNMVVLAQEINSPAFRLLFDTGNVVFDTSEDPMEFYLKVRPYIEYVHIKDYTILEDGNRKATYPGEGKAKVKEILQQLKKSGYNSFISIEPHLASVVHEGKVGDPEVTYQTYITYGKKLMGLISGL